MKILIPKGITQFELTKDTISTTQLDRTKIIIITSRRYDPIGLLTRIANRDDGEHYKWTVIDLLRADNFWDIMKDDPVNVLDIFSNRDWKIIQFDSSREFAEWLMTHTEERDPLNS